MRILKSNRQWMENLTEKVRTDISTLQNQHMTTDEASLSKEQTAARKEKVLVVKGLICQNKAKAESLRKQNDIRYEGVSFTYYFNVNVKWSVNHICANTRCHGYEAFIR